MRKGHVVVQHTPIEGNNFFGQHAGTSFNNGSVEVHGKTPKHGSKKTRVATFASYADSVNGFVKDDGAIVQGKRSPADFVQALQHAKKFGIYDDGSPVPGYVNSTAVTIVGLRPYIARRML